MVVSSKVVDGVDAIGPKDCIASHEPVKYLNAPRAFLRFTNNSQFFFVRFSETASLVSVDGERSRLAASSQMVLAVWHLWAHFLGVSCDTMAPVVPIANALASMKPGAHDDNHGQNAPLGLFRVD